MVVERNRVDVIVESGPLHCSPPEGVSVEGRRQNFLAARQLGVESDVEEGRNEQIYLIFSLEVEDLKLEAEDLHRNFSWRRRTSRRSAPGGWQGWRHFHIRENRFQPVDWNVILLRTNLKLEIFIFSVHNFGLSPIQLRERQNRKIFTHKYKFQA